MKYFIRQDGGYSQVDELTNPSYFYELVRKGSREITEEEFKKATYIPEPQIDPKEIRKVEIKARLNELDKDFIQAVIGYNVPDLAARKQEFNELYSELCTIEGKTARQKKTTINI